MLSKNIVQYVIDFQTILFIANVLVYVTECHVF